ncbi:MAG: phosphatase PAP2 family protein [Acidimicrobiia bacterium]
MVLALVAVLAAAVIALMALVGRAVRASGTVNRFDQRVTDSVVDSRTDAVVSVAKTVTLAGSWLVTFPALAALAIVAPRTTRPALTVVVAVAAVGGTELANNAVKHLVQRPRPPPAVRLVVTHGWSFPSGHTAYATAVFLTFALLTTPLLTRRVVRAGVWIAALTVVALVAWSRVLLGAHWCTDVLSAVVLGVSWVTGVRRILIRAPASRHQAASLVAVLALSLVACGSTRGPARPSTTVTSAVMATSTAPRSTAPTTSTVATGSALGPRSSERPGATPQTPPATTTAPSTATVAAGAAPEGSPPTVAARPDPALTPGATDPRVTQATIDRTICVPGYTRTVRNVTAATKSRVYAAYGIRSHGPGEYEIDHLIPLELGGSNDVANLWPEPQTGPAGADTKDALENSLHRLVCSGRIALVRAQQAMARDWYALAQFLGGPGSPAVG